MKIGVVGCGAVGIYYGGKLGRSGQEMHFLLRSDYDAVRRSGIQVFSPEGNFRYQPKCAKSPDEIGHCDLVMISLKSTANARYADLLPPLVGTNTAVLTLQNGLGNEEQLAALFGGEKIMGGLCFVCLNRTQPGVVHHFAHGNIVLGEYGRWPEPRTHDVAGMLRNAGVPCKVSDNLERSHWEKLVWNIPFNGIGVASAAGLDAVKSGLMPVDAKPGACLPTDKLLGDPEWEGLVRELMLEVIAAANAKGLKLSTDLAQMHIDRTRKMGTYKASTLLDFELGRPLELENLFLEPLRQARQAGMKAPRLTALCIILAALDARSQGGQGSTTTR